MANLSTETPPGSGASGTGSETAGEITRLLRAWQSEETRAGDRLFAEVYDPLRAIAARALYRERHRHHQATSLVHELFLRLRDDRPPDWHNRVHFYAIAARVMRRILVEEARHRQRQKRGGDRRRVAFPETLAAPRIAASDPRILDLDRALRRLADRDQELAALVELRFFAGFSIAETARALGCSTATVGRRWRYAKAWLYREIKSSAPEGGSA